MNKSCHVRMGHVTHMNKSCHIHQRMVYRESLEPVIVEQRCEVVVNMAVDEKDHESSEEEPDVLAADADGGGGRDGEEGGGAGGGHNDVRLVRDAEVKGANFSKVCGVVVFL